MPKSVIPSFYGVANESKSEQSYLFGDDAIHNALSNHEIRNPISKDGTVEDWDSATRLWEYAITSRLTTVQQTHPTKNGLNDDQSEDPQDVEMNDVEERERSLEDHPLLMTETGWTTAKQREQSVEVAMESWGVPAFWLGRTGVLAA